MRSRPAALSSQYMCTWNASSQSLEKLPCSGHHQPDRRTDSRPVKPTPCANTGEKARWCSAAVQNATSRSRSLWHSNEVRSLACSMSTVSCQWLLSEPHHTSATAAASSAAPGGDVTAVLHCTVDSASSAVAAALPPADTFGTPPPGQCCAARACRTAKGSLGEAPRSRSSLDASLAGVYAACSPRGGRSPHALRTAPCTAAPQLSPVCRWVGSAGRRDGQGHHTAHATSSGPGGHPGPRPAAVVQSGVLHRKGATRDDAFDACFMQHRVWQAAAGIHTLGPRSHPRLQRRARVRCPGHIEAAQLKPLVAVFSQCTTVFDSRRRPGKPGLIRMVSIFFIVVEEYIAKPRSRTGAHEFIHGHHLQRVLQQCFIHDEPVIVTFRCSSMHGLALSSSLGLLKTGLCRKQFLQAQQHERQQGGQPIVVEALSKISFFVEPYTFAYPARCPGLLMCTHRFTAAPVPRPADPASAAVARCCQVDHYYLCMKSHRLPY